jgi:hypothetical protein
MLPANTFHNLSLYDNTESALPLWGIEAAHFHAVENNWTDYHAAIVELSGSVGRRAQAMTPADRGNGDQHSGIRETRGQDWYREVSFTLPGEVSRLEPEGERLVHVAAHRKTQGSTYFLHSQWSEVRHALP